MTINTPPEIYDAYCANCKCLTEHNESSGKCLVAGCGVIDPAKLDQHQVHTEDTQPRNKIKLIFASPIANEFKWFAWHPVRTADRGWRWCRFVYKRRYGTHDYLPGPMYEFFMYTVEKKVLS